MAIKNISIPPVESSTDHRVLTEQSTR